MLPMLAGCADPGAQRAEHSANGTRLAGSMRELFERALEMPDLASEAVPIIERAIDSGSISPGDYEQVFTDYIGCLSREGIKGLPFKKGVDGIYRLQTVDSARVSRDRFVEVNVTCAQTYNLIETLYNIQTNNPDLLGDSGEVGVACLRRGGLVDAEYDAAKFTSDLRGLHFPFDINDPEAQRCLCAAGVAVGD